MAELYDRHARHATRFAVLLTGDRQAAEDIVQDAFVRLFARFRDLRNPDGFETYLHRTIVNLSRDRFRRLRLERANAARQPVSLNEEAEGEARIDDREVLRSALRSLPRRQRAALILRFYTDLSEQQTAEVLQCSVPAVKSLAARATASLRQQLDRHEPIHRERVRSERNE